MQWNLQLLARLLLDHLNPPGLEVALAHFQIIALALIGIAGEPNGAARIPARWAEWFIDETWASNNMARLRGRAPRGKRLRAGIPHGHWKTTTFVAGLRLTGMVAPMVLDGPINRIAFQAYVDQVLVPALEPGDVVVMDNLWSHKGPAVRAAIEAASALYSALQPRLQPDRERLRQAEGPPGQGR